MRHFQVIFAVFVTKCLFQVQGFPKYTDEEAPTHQFQIVKLDELLSPHLKPDEEIIGYDTDPLTVPGENLAGTLISLDVNVKNRKTGETKTMHLVDKTIPETQYKRDRYNTEVTFRKEMDFYQKVVPILLELQQEHGVPKDDWITNIVPKFYGARTGYGSKVDDNAALLLENLKFQGYTLKNKNVGLNFQEARFVLEKLAYLHALPIALKKQRPDKYELLIKPAAKHFLVNEADQQNEMESRLTMFQKIFGNISIDPNIIEAALCALKKTVTKVPSVLEPLVTLSHGDLWINNILFREDPEIKELPLQIALLDFQMTRLRSPAYDILYFIFSSVSPVVWKEHFDELFEAYYESFTKCLLQVKCEASEFTKSAFREEMVRESYDSDVLSKIFRLSRITEVSCDEVARDRLWFLNIGLGGVKYLNKLQDLLLEFNKRGWLNL